MPAVKFTQYLMPDGRTREQTIDLPQAVYDKACLIYQAGFHLACEILSTGMISLTIEDRAHEFDVACVVCHNGPDVPITVQKMIMDFDIEATLEGRKNDYV